MVGHLGLAVRTMATTFRKIDDREDLRSSSSGKSNHMPSVDLRSHFLLCRMSLRARRGKPDEGSMPVALRRRRCRGQPSGPAKVRGDGGSPPGVGDARRVASPPRPIVIQ